jgi:pimeloyl-ACP methyl ester carboxylesterase
MTHRYGLALVCVLLFFPAIVQAKQGSFDSNGVRIRYIVQGEGEAVVLIHGFAANVQLQWFAPGIFDTLARGHRVIAMDVRGHGSSGKPENVEKYGTEMVEDVVRLLDHLKIQKAHIVGYSMGSLITGKMLATHPDRMLSATLGGTGIFLEEEKLPPFVDKLADSLDRGKGMRPLVAALTPPGKPILPEATIQMLNRTLIGNNSKPLAAVVHSWKALVVSKEKLKANKVPTLALVGMDDPIKEITVDNIKRDFANLKVVEIEGADHITAYCTPKFIYNLRKFLDEHKSR